jgi:hypothetical protein
MVIDSVKWAEEEDIMRRRYEYINYGHVFPTSSTCDFRLRRQHSCYTNCVYHSRTVTFSFECPFVK